MANSVEWICEYRNCNIKFKRYACYVKKNTKRFCCQTHAALEQYAIKKDEGHRVQSQKEIHCSFCNKIIIATNSQKKYCEGCLKIRNNIYSIRKKSHNLQNFTPLNYYELLKLQNNKCAICKIDKCSTGNRFAIDHDHKTGKIRGLLCLGCNTKLGWFDRNAESVLSYLNA